MANLEKRDDFMNYIYEVKFLFKIYFQGCQLKTILAIDFNKKNNKDGEA